MASSVLFLSTDDPQDSTFAECDFSLELTASDFLSFGSIFITLSFKESKILSNLSEPIILFLLDTFKFAAADDDDEDDGVAEEEEEDE